MKIRNLAVAVAVAAAFVVPAQAQTSSGVVATSPGKATAAQTVKITATITAIDKKSRDVTLKGPEGRVETITAGPEVKNFDQMKVGDQVTAEYVEAITLELKKGGKQVVARTEQAGAAKAKPGEKPAGAVGRQVTVVADVVNVDTAKKIVTLKGPKQTVELPVRDPEQLKLIAKGDQVEATFTQALAIVVEPVKKK
jgi:Cu/Ag efflux protein CusF